MSKEEIQKGNEMIARFMGLREYRHQWAKAEDIQVIDGNTFAYEWHRTLHYNDKWDWLKPAIDKALKDAPEDYRDSDIFGLPITADIKDAFNSLVEFLSWFMDPNDHNH